MMLLQTTRALRFALQNAKRNLWLSIVTTIIIAVAVFSISLVSALNVIGHQALQSVEQRVDVTVELKADTTEDQGQALVSRVKALPQVAAVTYTSKTAALDAFKQTHKDDANIQQLLSQLTDNPLPASITIKAQHIGDFDSIVKFLNQDENAKIVADSTRDFKDSQLVIDRLTNITNRVRDIGVAVSSVFALLSLIVVINTIRIAIYTHREEIGIMRLVGASDNFIRLPFILESLMYSLIGAGIAAVAMIMLWQGASPALHQFFFKDTTVGVAGLLGSNFWSVIGLQFIGALVLSTMSAFVATRRYLKV